MNVAVIGAGKLGFPVALAFERYGSHVVCVHDKHPAVALALARRSWPHREERADELLADSKIEHVDLDEAIKRARLVFVCVQTPHAPEYDGSRRLPADRKDFDYTYLKAAVADVAAAIRAHRGGDPPVIAVISTVLPGTCRRELYPLLGDLPFAYNPFFAAMGTVIRDVTNPEFVLIGEKDEASGRVLRDFYRTLHAAPAVTMSVESAELTKVAYNLFLSTKIAYADTLMEICHNIPGCNVDHVTGALRRATQRLISGRYLDGGLVDGGACHPRDGIAMSWLVRELDVSFNLFEHIVVSREQQTAWLADLVLRHRGNLPLVILGTAFKPDTDIVAGSPALLLADILRGRGVEFTQHDPIVDDWPDAAGDWHYVTDRPSAFLIATKHDVFRKGVWYPRGSVVIDPHRYVDPADHPGVTVIPVGVGR